MPPLYLGIDDAAISKLAEKAQLVLVMAEHGKRATNLQGHVWTATTQAQNVQRALDSNDWDGGYVKARVYPVTDLSQSMRIARYEGMRAIGACFAATRK